VGDYLGNPRGCAALEEAWVVHVKGIILLPQFAFLAVFGHFLTEKPQLTQNFLMNDYVEVQLFNPYRRCRALPRLYIGKGVEFQRVKLAHGEKACAARN
jgi:hypothetical protein